MKSTMLDIWHKYGQPERYVYQLHLPEDKVYVGCTSAGKDRLLRYTTPKGGGGRFVHNSEFAKKTKILDIAESYHELKMLENLHIKLAKKQYDDNCINVLNSTYPGVLLENVQDGTRVTFSNQRTAAYNLGISYESLRHRYRTTTKNVIIKAVDGNSYKILR